MRVLGIDPGSRRTGFGIIKMSGNKSNYITSGIIKITAKELPERLHTIYQQVSHVVSEFKPDVLAIEQVFVHKNANSALKLGHARGAAICAALNQEVPVFEYAARQIKQAVVGYGAADKQQVQRMITMLLSLTGLPSEDAADALAVALCHSHTRAVIR